LLKNTFHNVLLINTTSNFYNSIEKLKSIPPSYVAINFKHHNINVMPMQKGGDACITCASHQFQKNKSPHKAKAKAMYECGQGHPTS
jgi:hypothetical protein